jgi:hypothetical protein
MRFIVWFFVLAFGSVLAWRAYPKLATGSETRPAPSKPFVFDNGTVREYLPPPEPGSAAALSSLPHGVMRKCVKGTKKIYTDVTCPPGHQELAVATDRVTVLPGPDKPARAAEPGAPPERRSTLRDALDMSGDDQLRQRIVDRAVDRHSK